MEIRQITIVGTGLIGASFGLALKKYGYPGRIVGCDKPLVLARAIRMGAVDLGVMELRQAVYGADVVLLATPVGGILDLIEKVGPIVPATTLLTDVGSTKQEMIERARAVFGSAVSGRFLGGHPMAGKEHSGVEHADADLFRSAVWLITPGSTLTSNNETTEQQAAFLKLVQSVGAHIISMDAQRHDRLCAWISHLPQMLSTALAAGLEDEFGDDPELAAIGGRALREMTRIAASPYSMWRDIAITNTANIEKALMRLEQRLAHLRENLRTRELQEEFERANRFTQH